MIRGACQVNLLTRYVDRPISERMGCETVFVSVGHGCLFHNPVQSKPAPGAAYLTFTTAARALPVLHRIKDSLAINWSEAFE